MTDVTRCARSLVAGFLFAVGMAYGIDFYDRLVGFLRRLLGWWRTR